MNPTLSSPKTSAADGERVQIVSIRAKNIKCIREAQIDAEGAITEIRGDAGSGKTSWLRAIEAAIKGIDPELVRKGQDSAEVVLTMDRARIERAIRPGSEDLTVFDANGIKMTIGQAKQFLKALSASETFDTLGWVMLASGPEAGKTERLRRQRDMLLQAIPLQLTLDELERPTAILSADMQRTFSEVDISGIDLSQHALVVSQQLGKAVYQHRKGVNVHLEEAKRTLGQLSAPEMEAPGFSLEDCEEQAKLAEQAYHDATAKFAAYREKKSRVIELEHQIRDFPEGIMLEAEIDVEIANIDRRKADAEILIDELNRDIEVERGKIEKAQEDLGDILEMKSQRKQIALIEKSINGIKESLKDDAEAIAEKARDEMVFTAAGRDARKQLDEFTKAKEQAESAEKSVEPLDALVKFFRDDLPKKLIEQMEMPVEDMTIDGDVIKIGGIPLHQLGTSQMIPIAVKVAAARNPKCGFLLIDRAESLGSEDRKVLAETAREQGLKLLLTIVDADAEPSEGVIVMENGAPK